MISHFIFPLFQIQKLKKDIETQSSQRTALESRANDAEKKVEELTAKLNAVSAQSLSIVQFREVFLFGFSVVNLIVFQVSCITVTKSIC